MKSEFEEEYAQRVCDSHLGVKLRWDLFNQAKHNLRCAEDLLKIVTYRDWAITAAFYAAIHFVEAGLTGYPLEETRVLPGEGDYHFHRQELVRLKFGRECYVKYRALREASQNVRYLVDQGRKTRTGTSLGYYSQEDAIQLVHDNVPSIQREVEKATGVDLS